MTAFLSSLTLLGKIYLGFASVGSVFFGLKLLSLIVGFSHDIADGTYDGFDSHFDSVQSAIDNIDNTDAITDVHLDIHHDIDFHHDVDMPHADADISEQDLTNNSHDTSNFAYFSVQSIAAFSMMFGLIGLATIHYTNYGNILSFFFASIAGIFMAFISTKFIRALYGLSCSGNDRPISALFNTGRVYLTIPANGKGEIEIEVNGRLRVCDAISAKNVELKTGEKIKVINVDKDGVMTVEKDKTE